MIEVRAERVLAAERRGSSLPVIVEAGGRRWLTKLRGAAQGPAALVAEVIVAGLAAVLGLRVPQRALVALDGGVPCDDRDAELRDLLAASRGANLGFALLEGARDVGLRDVARIHPETAARIVWLDALVENPDRTARNTNLLWWRGEPWLVDHGAALGFHHHWQAVTEASPRRAYDVARHVLSGCAADIAGCDGALAASLSRAAIESAVGEVPAALLQPLLEDATSEEALRRRRAAYVAYLWKRLKPPRPFALARAA